MDTQAITTWTSTPPAKRDAWTAISRGFRCRCPHCGEGKLFRAFLKPVDACASCGENFAHQRADDLPAYLVIVIVGHILIPIVLAVETNYAPDLVLQFILWPSLALVMSLALLQPVKGAIVGLQWAFRMHGFDDNSPGDPLEANLKNQEA